jgi:hypothetical protein
MENENAFCLFFISILFGKKSAGKKGGRGGGFE